MKRLVRSRWAPAPPPAKSPANAAEPTPRQAGSQPPTPRRRNPAVETVAQREHKPAAAKAPTDEAPVGRRSRPRPKASEQ